MQFVSVYAFSIDNFQRSPDEVGSLMHMAEAKYYELAQVRCSPVWQRGVFQHPRIAIRGQQDLPPARLHSLQPAESAPIPALHLMNTLSKPLTA